MIVLPICLKDVATQWSANQLRKPTRAKNEKNKMKINGRELGDEYLLK